MARALHGGLGATRQESEHPVLGLPMTRPHPPGAWPEALRHQVRVVQPRGILRVLPALAVSSVVPEIFGTAPARARCSAQDPSTRASPLEASSSQLCECAQ